MNLGSAPDPKYQVTNMPAINKNLMKFSHRKFNYN